MLQSVICSINTPLHYQIIVSMKRVRPVRETARIVSSDSEGNVDELCQPGAKKPRKCSSSKTSPADEKKEVVGCDSWSPAEVISRDLQLQPGSTERTVSLLQAGNSVPFLAR